MPLDLENLHNAIGSLDQALAVFQVFEEPESAPRMGGTQEAWRRVVQSGVIKHFELTMNSRGCSSSVGWRRMSIREPEMALLVGSCSDWVQKIS